MATLIRRSPGSTIPLNTNLGSMTSGSATFATGAMNKWGEELQMPYRSIINSSVYGDKITNRVPVSDYYHNMPAQMASGSGQDAAPINAYGLFTPPTSLPKLSAPIATAAGTRLVKGGTTTQNALNSGVYEVWGRDMNQGILTVPVSGSKGQSNDWRDVYENTGYHAALAPLRENKLTTQQLLGNSLSPYGWSDIKPNSSYTDPFARNSANLLSGSGSKNTKFSNGIMYETDAFGREVAGSRTRVSGSGDLYPGSALNSLPQKTHTDYLGVKSIVPMSLEAAKVAMMKANTPIATKTGTLSLNNFQTKDIDYMVKAMTGFNPQMTEAERISTVAAHTQAWQSGSWSIKSTYTGQRDAETGQKINTYSVVDGKGVETDLPEIYTLNPNNGWLNIKASDLSKIHQYALPYKSASLNIDPSKNNAKSLNVDDRVTLYGYTKYGGNRESHIGRLYSTKVGGFMTLSGTKASRGRYF